MGVTRTVKIGGFDHIKPVLVGGDSPVVIQTMWKKPLMDSDLKNVVKRIDYLDRMGCRLLRFAVPDTDAAELLGILSHMVSMPLVADIHFNYKIALRCLDFPIAKIRINPGNIGSREKTVKVLEKAASKNIPVRIGVNAGSLPKDLRSAAQRSRSTAEDRARILVEAACRELSIFNELGFNNVLVSIKASETADNLIANRIWAQTSDVPLHIGITEAGPIVTGAVRSGAALSLLLAEGIGDTIRVSLSDTMENEIITAREICRVAQEMAAVNGNSRAVNRLKRDGVTIISCPRCGRFCFDTHDFCSRWLPRLYAMDKNLTVAVMGCEVNGPEEARHADVGITGSGAKVLIFRKGVIVQTVDNDNADRAFAQELENFSQ